MDESPKRKAVTHVIFDLDGLLLDTEPLFTEANSRALLVYGKQFTWEMKERMMGRKQREAIAVLLEINGLSDHVTIEEYAEYSDKILFELFPTAKMLPGAERLVKHLAKHNIPMAICSGSTEDGYLMKTKNYRQFFDGHFEHYVAASTDPDVKVGKPAPDCFLVCMKRFHRPVESPSDVLVFEDAPNGVEAALAAGMQVVMVPDPRVVDEARRRATLCLDSLEKFDPVTFGLPAYEL